MPLEVLHLALVFERRGPAAESAEIAPLAGPGIFLAGVKAVLAIGKLADHGPFLAR
jgi:hypothetical protein